MKYITSTTGEEKAVRWMDKAAMAAQKSSCARSKCGAIIVKDGEVVGEGYNSPPGNVETQRCCAENKDMLHEKVTDKTCCVHAEQRALMDALKNNPDKIIGSRLYFIRLGEDGNKSKAGRPYCTICSKMALDAGVAEFVLWHEKGICVYPTDEYNKLSYEYTEE